MSDRKVILSIDGGGIRGAASAEFLSRVDAQLRAEHGTRVRDCVDFFAGTSTGSLIALSLASTDLTMQEISDLYGAETAKQIFTENKGWFEFDGINAPKYEGKGKTAALKKSLKNATLQDAYSQGKHALAVSYDIVNRKPKVFKTTDPQDRSEYVAQIADASSAAPTYFPTRELDANPSRWLIDGGVTANNPTMCVIAEAMKAWKEDGIGLQDVSVISIGTGYLTRSVDGPDSVEWGALGWFKDGHLMDIITDERVVAYQAMTLMPSGQYIRVNSELSKSTWLPKPKVPSDDMDNIKPANIQKLKELGAIWFEQYGNAVIDMLLGNYNGPSLDHLDNATGRPIELD